MRSRAFTEIVKEISSGYRSNFKWQWRAISALQELAESYLEVIFSASKLAATHAKRVTVQPKDMQLVRIMCNTMQPYMGQTYFEQDGQLGDEEAGRGLLRLGTRGDPGDA